MEAKVTITATPAELDFIRESLAETAQAAHDARQAAPVADRRDLQEREAIASSLLSKLGVSWRPERRAA